MKLIVRTGSKPHQRDHHLISNIYINLRKFQQTIQKYPRPSTTHFWRKSFYISILGYLGSVPGLCWKFLKQNLCRTCTNYYMLNLKSQNTVELLKRQSLGLKGSVPNFFWLFNPAVKKGQVDVIGGRNVRSQVSDQYRPSVGQRHGGRRSSSPRQLITGKLTGFLKSI